MNHLTYGSFDSTNADIAFSDANGYTDPASESETRKQLSYPLKEIKTFLHDAISIDDSDNVIQLRVNSGKVQYRTSGNTWTDVSGGIPSGGTTGQVLKKHSNTDYDVEWGSASELPSFVGMVVSGTNLTTEASVKAKYGNSTSWTLLSSVILASEHVYGNGKGLAFTDSITTVTMYSSGTSANYGDGYGKDVGTAVSGKGMGSGHGVIGVPTKAQANGSDENTGLIVDTKAVYTWERTA